VIVLRDRGAVAELTLGVMGENSQIPIHTSLSGISQAAMRRILLAQAKKLVCVYASLFGDEVGYLWWQLPKMKTFHSFFHLTISFR
jgi:hypothetical protein